MVNPFWDKWFYSNFLYMKKVLYVSLYVFQANKTKYCSKPKG